MEMVNDVLTIAYYPFVDNLSYNQMSMWQREVKAPSERELTASRITRRTQSITEKNRMDLFRRRAARMSKDELCAVDSTSISIYGFNLVDIRWGKNKERMPLRQTIEAVADWDDIRRCFNMLTISFNEDNSVASYEVNSEKADNMLLTAGFFASKAIDIDIGPLQAKASYGMRDEQEKAFALQKGPLNQDRLRTWSESSKHGRMFICFVRLILASYVRHMWEEDDYLHNKFDSTEAILEEMRTIRCIEHTGRMKFITPFIGAQVEICKAFGFDIPDGCATAYVSKAKPTVRKRMRQPKPKTEKQTY